MQISSIFVKRPVTTTMIFMGLALFGILSWFKIPRELFPNISVPQIVIITKYANAAPEEIENLITKPIEESIGTVPDLKQITSISKEGMSAVTLSFAWGTDMGLSHLAVREKLDRMKGRLPLEAEEAIIKRVNPFAHPVVIISVTGGLDLPTMTELCEEVIKKKLEKADGVGAVQISGGQKREILVEVDRGRLEASSVSLPMVVDALKNANYDYPAGTTQSKVVEYLIRTYGRFQKVDDIGKIIVRVENPEVDPVYKWSKREDKKHGSPGREQRLIPLSHLAEIKWGLQDRTSYSRYNGRENVSISIQKQADANTVEVSQAVKTALEDLKAIIPKKMALDIVYDESTYIVSSLSNMRDNVLIGGVLAIFVLLYFLGNIRDSFNVGLAIPVAFFCTSIFMYLMGLSINMMTLAGLALSAGSLTDSATCVAENIERHHRIFKKPLMQASMDGANEMVASMFSATLTNIAVFLPLLFITGIAQQLFQDLFLVTAFTNLASLFVSLTLIPRLAAYSVAGPSWIKTPNIDRFVLTVDKKAKMDGFLEKALIFSLDHVRTVVEVILMLGAISVAVLVFSPRIFMPKIDQGQFIIKLTMPVGTKLEVTNSNAVKLENIMAGFEHLNVMVNIGSAQEDEDIEALKASEAQLVVTLDQKSDLNTNDIIEKFKKRVASENLQGGHLAYILQDSPLRAALKGGAPIEVEIKGPDLQKLADLSKMIMTEFEANPHLFSVQTTFSVASHENKVLVDKDRASSFQLSVADIAKTALIAIRGFVATKFKEGGKETDIRVRLRKQDRDDRETIRRLALRSPKGEMVPLDSVAKVVAGLGASEIRHLDQLRAVLVTAEITGIPSGQAVEEVKKLVHKYRIYKDYTIEVGGESRRMAESYSSMKFTFILAIILVYMIMAGEFESLAQPLIIMATVPFSIIGVAFTLFLSNTPVSAVVGLGVVILSGIVVNNGIVLIDHINGLRGEGVPLREAVIKGSSNRLRPILITSLSTILAVLPMALGIGKGDELAQPMAVVTFGGLFISTLLTLIVIPTAYFKFAQYQDKKKRG